MKRQEKRNELSSVGGVIFLALIVLVYLASCQVESAPASGALAIHPTNPYYFQDSSGNPLLLLGNSMNCFSDYNYDYITYFNTLQAKGLNFSRTWVCKGRECLPDGSVVFYFAFQRPGPGTAQDGKAKCDLTKYNASFFTRLRSVCQAAKDRGIFLQLILLDAWNIKRTDRFIVNAYNVLNNINGVDADVNNDGDAIDSGEFCSTSNTAVYNTQKAFIAKVIDETNQYDNILYEMANENYYSTSWEQALCDYTQSCEVGKPKQHLVMPEQMPNHDYGGIKTWTISTLHQNLLNARSLGQPLIWCTDGIGQVDDATVRKAMYTVYVSGGHADYDGTSFTTDQMLYLKTFAYSCKFWEMTPSNSLVASGSAYAMASNKEMAAYFYNGGTATLNLTGIAGSLKYKWFNTTTGAWSSEYSVQGGANRSFTAPDTNDWALRIWVSDDSQAPSVPTNVSATAQSSNSIQVSWTASTDNVGVTGYRVYRNGSQVGTSATTSYTDTGLSQNTTYSYTVSAYDSAWNDSGQSSPPATATTPPSSDTQPPSVPTNVSATAQSSSSIQVSWTASTDNIGVTGYKVSRNGSQAGTSATTSYTDTGLSPNTTYSYTVSAYDAAGNNSDQSPIPAVATTYSGSGTISPIADSYTKKNASDTNYGTANPMELKHHIPSDDRARYVWLKFNLGSEAVSAATFRIYQVKQGSVTQNMVVQLRGAEQNFGETTITWTNQPGGESGTWGTQIDSNQTWANISAWRALSATTFYNSNLGKTVSLRLRGESADYDTHFTLSSREDGSNKPYIEYTGLSATQPPSVPTSVSATAQSPTSTKVTWTASTDNVGVAGYRIYRNGTQVAASGTTSYTDTGLQSGTTYSYTISAYDAAGNNSAQSSPPAAAITLAAMGIAEIKGLPNSSSVGLASKAVTAVFSDRFYVEELDRHNGIKIVPLEMPTGLAIGNIVDVGGTVETVNGERCIANAAVSMGS